MIRPSMLSWSDKKRIRVALAGTLAAAAFTAGAALAIAASPLPTAQTVTPVAQAQAVALSPVSPNGVSWSGTRPSLDGVSWSVIYALDGVSWSGTYGPDGVSWS